MTTQNKVAPFTQLAESRKAIPQVNSNKGPILVLEQPRSREQCSMRQEYQQEQLSIIIGN